MKHIGSITTIRFMLDSLSAAQTEHEENFSVAYFIRHIGFGLLLGAFALATLPALPAAQIAGMAFMYPFARCGADALGQFVAENSAVYRWASSKPTLMHVLALQGEVSKTLLATFFAATGWIWIGLVVLSRWVMHKRNTARAI